MFGDRLRLPANRNCYRLSRVSWALLKLLVELSFWHTDRQTDRQTKTGKNITFLAEVITTVVSVEYLYNNCYSAWNIDRN